MIRYELFPRVIPVSFNISAAFFFETQRKEKNMVTIQYLLYKDGMVPRDKNVTFSSNSKTFQCIRNF